MRPIIFSALLVLTLTADVYAASVRTAGAYIGATTQDASGCIRAGGSFTPTTGGVFIFYHVIDVCSNPPYAVFLAEGWGTVPRAALVVESNLRRARLTLTITGAEPTLSVTGLVGSIDLTLVRTGEYSLYVNGQSRQTFASGTTIKTRGTRTEYSAAASGTFFGYAVTDFGGSTIGTTSDQTIEVTK
jgi:hypothetical protein